MRLLITGSGNKGNSLQIGHFEWRESTLHFTSINSDLILTSVIRMVRGWIVLQEAAQFVSTGIPLFFHGKQMITQTITHNINSTYRPSPSLFHSINELSSCQVETTRDSDSHMHAALNYSLSSWEQRSHSDPHMQETGPETTNSDKGHILISFYQIIILGSSFNTLKGMEGWFLSLLNIPTLAY